MNVSKFLLLLFALIVGAQSLIFAEDIRDVKGPVDYPAQPVMVFIIAGIFLLFLFVYFMSQKNRAKQAPRTVEKHCWDIAYERLGELIKKDMLVQKKYHEYYCDLSDIVRKYIEDRYTIRAPEMTTEEFLDKMQGDTSLQSEHKAILKEFLLASDMVKFAKHSPEIKEGENSFKLAVKLIDETKVNGPAVN